MSDVWMPEWSTPVFSLQERARRWSRVRELMARDGVDVIICLPNPGRHNRGAADALYLTQLGEYNEGPTVAFPLEGEPTAWLMRAGGWPASSWLTDIRRQVGRGGGAATVIPWLKERGLERATIGIAHLTKGILNGVRADEGWAPWQSVETLKRELPDAKLVSATEMMGETRYVKSEEEIEFLRKATALAEDALQAGREVARAGVWERHVWATMLYAQADAGGSLPVMMGWVSGPLGNTYHRLEVPSFRNLEIGDVIVLELEARWAGYSAQADDTFSIGPAHQDLKNGMELTFECFNRVFEALKPGITIGELEEIGNIKGMNGRGEAGLTLHGRGTGEDGPLLAGGRTPELRAVEIRENVVVDIAPATTVDGKIDYGHWGDTVVVRRNGAERLGTRPMVLHEFV